MNNGEKDLNLTARRFTAEFKANNVVNGNPNEFNPGNLAFQRSLMEFLDEFTEVISGELRYLEPPGENNR